MEVVCDLEGEVVVVVMVVMGFGGGRRRSLLRQSGLGEEGL